MLTLYGFGAVSNSLKPLLTLYEKKLPFAHRVLDGAVFEQHQDWFKAINPRAQAPALDHDGDVVIESTVICEYLEDAFPRTGAPLRPVNPAERARMRVWCKWVDEFLWPQVSLISWSILVPRLTAHLADGEFEALVARIPVPERREKWRSARAGFEAQVLGEAAARIGQAARLMNEQLAGRRWFLGEAYSLADICVFSSAAAMDEKFADVVNADDAPHLTRWLDEMRARPAVQAMYAAAAADTVSTPRHRG